MLEIASIGLAFERGWCSVDVAMRGRDFRFICTHLEQELWPDLQAAQVEELLAGPAQTRKPIILVGDFNADPLHRDGSYAYDLISAAGFTDAWAKLNPQDPAGGLTWGNDALLADPNRIGSAFVISRYDQRGVMRMSGAEFRVAEGTGLVKNQLVPGIGL